jgi:hypothetical protein|tara:strand:- start:528 stop:665 length:138 start_codon:yes stop_codon:yes gene_type:complete
MLINIIYALIFLIFLILIFLIIKAIDRGIKGKYKNKKKYFNNYKN